MKKSFVFTTLCALLMITFTACSNQVSEKNEEGNSDHETSNVEDPEVVDELTKEEIDEIVKDADNKLELKVSNESGEMSESGHPLFTVVDDQITIFFMVINTKPDQNVFMYINNELITTLEAESIYEDTIQIHTDYLIEGQNLLKVEQYTDEETKEHVINSDEVEFEIK